MEFVNIECDCEVCVIPRCALYEYTAFHPGNIGFSLAIYYILCGSY